VLLLAEDATSKSAHGKRIRSVDVLWTREVAVAQATVDNRLSRRKAPKTVLAILVTNGSKANVMLMLQRSFSDRVTVDDSDMA